MRIAAWCGSLGAASANSAALDVAVEALTADGVETEALGAPSAIPAFRPERVDDPPTEVADLRRILDGVAGVLIAAPEYAAGLAGSMKNALDWMVGSGTLYRKPVAVLSAGTTGGSFAIEQLVRTLTWQGAHVVAVLGISAPRTKMDAGGRFADAPTIAAISQWAGTLRAAVDEPPGDRMQRVGVVIAPFGIDAARLGDLPP